MFLVDLSPDEKKAFFSLATDMIAADGKVTESEQTMLQLLMAELGLSPGDSPRVAIEQALDVLAGSDSTEAVLTELIGLALVDQEYPDEERALVTRVAEALGISSREQRSLEQWVGQVISKGANPGACVGYFCERYALMQGAVVG